MQRQQRNGVPSVMATMASVSCGRLCDFVVSCASKATKIFHTTHNTDPKQDHKYSPLSSILISPNAFCSLFSSPFTP